MKKIVGISLFIFLAAVTAIVGTGLLFSPENPGDNSGPEPLLPGGTGPIILSTQEIAKHSLVSDCWMIIDSKVYNLTNYLGEHPGGASTILPYCGKDGSQGFATKDKSRAQSHSGYADSLLANYYLGDLGQTIGQAPNLPPSPSPAPGNNISTPAPLPSSGADITLNAQEIAKHSSTGNCWMVMNGKVYNITGYLAAHPGGVGTIAPYCGKDGTQAFQGKPHSSYADSLLNSYYIGVLNQTASAAQIQQNIQNTAQITPPPGGGGDEYDD